jgi:hypothetical protein
MIINHRLLGKRIALEPIVENKSTSGIFTGEEGLNKGFRIGKIIQLGTDIPESYKSLKIGDLVTYPIHSAAEMFDWKTSEKFMLVQPETITYTCLEPVKINNPLQIIT